MAKMHMNKSRYLPPISSDVSYAHRSREAPPGWPSLAGRARSVRSVGWRRYLLSNLPAACKRPHGSAVACPPHSQIPDTGNDDPMHAFVCVHTYA
jgi:hypothetical protein